MRTLSYLSALAIVIASGIVHGVWTGRWAASDAIAARVAALGRVPADIGDWRGQDQALDRRVMESAGIEGYLMRRYEDRRQGGAVTVLIVCGRPGPIAVHTPEVCYKGAGYESAAARAKVPIEGGRPAPPDEMWAAAFGKQGPVTGEYLRILYSWSDGGPWTASDRPRLDFAGSPALYKMYIIRQMGDVGEDLRGDPAVGFARLFLPALRESLLAAP